MKWRLPASASPSIAHRSSFILPNLDHYAERGLEVAQVIVFVERAFAVEHEEGRAFLERKRAGVPGAAMQFESGGAVHQERRHFPLVGQIAVFVAGRGDGNNGLR